MLGLEPWILVAGFAVTLVAALLQSTIGFGFAILSVPILSLIHPELVPVPQILMSIPLTVSSAWRERHAIKPKEVGWVLAGRLPGALTGLWVLGWASTRQMDLVIGSLVVGAAAVVGTGVKIPMTRATQLAAGWASGTGNMVSSIGGPPLALLYGRSRGPEIRANLGAIFVIGISITIVTRLAASLISMQDLKLALCWLPAVGIGFWLSRFLTGKIEGRGLRLGVIVVAGGAGLALLARALF